MIFFFFTQINIETKKQAENLLVLNAIIPKACKKWSKNRNSQVLEKTLLLAFMNFLIINIGRCAGINVVNALTETYFFTSNFILQVVNIFLLLFWNLCVLDKLGHCFLNVKGHLKLIKIYNHYCCWYQCYYKWHFYNYFHIVHYRWINWITWTCTHCISLFPFACKSLYKKTKIIPIDLSPLTTQKHARNCSQL